MKGIGTDLTKLSRFNQLYFNERFISRVLTLREKEDFLATHPALRQKFIAKRFAGKEAFSKAIGTGIGAKLSFQDIEITSLPNTAPTIKCLHKNFKELQSLISFSDEKIENDVLIIAFVVVF